MTGFIASQVGGAFTPLVAKDKGDISNRARCSGEQFVNNAKMLIGDTVVIGGTVAVAKSAARGGKLGELFSKGFDKILKGVAKLKLKKGNVGGTKNILKFIKSAPMAGKAGALALMVAIPALSYITCKNIYKKGQIDQRYTDRAKIENHSKNILD